MSKKKVLVFFDVSVDGDPYERMIFELFTDVAPKTCENFRQLCTGEKGGSVKTGKPLNYKGTFFHRIIEGYVAQGGDFLRQNGNYGESIYDGKFPDESPKLRHDGPGLLSMAVADRDGRGSLFSITFKADHHLDRKNVVFGKLVKGHELLKKIENAGDDEGKPTVTVKIINSGELNDDEKKGNKLKTGKDAIEEHNHEVKRKGKHKKSSKRRRKRRRYYTSESDTSTDSDMDSSESDTDSDSDSDSDTSSLSDTSSSSDNRHKKRKRSKRNRHRRGKRKDRRREKRHKRRDKKSKRKSKRSSISDSVSEVKTGSSSQDGDAVGVSDGKHKATGNQSPLVEPENSKVSHKKGDAADFSVMGDGEFLKENGGHQSNGNRVRMRSDRAADRHPDVLDDLPSRSRIRSLSPRRSMSKSVSRSPRNARRTPIISAKHSRRSRSLSISPPYSRRSKSRTPLKRASPPAMSHSRQSRSRSATVSPPRQRLARSPARASSRKLPLRSVSRSPVRSSRRSPNRSSGRPSRRSISRSPVRPTHRSVSRSSGRAPQRRSPNPSPVRASRRSGRRSYSGSPISPCHRARSPVSGRRRSSLRSASVDGSPEHVRRGREFSHRFSYVRCRSPDQSPVRSYHYGGNRDRYSNYRRSPRRYQSPPRGRTSPSPIRYSRSFEVRQSKSRGSVSPNHAARSSSGSPPRKAGLVSYDDGSPKSDRH